MNIKLHSYYADLGKNFSASAKPERIENPQILMWNQSLATELGLNLTPTEQAQYFSGKKLFAGSKPVAMAYSGHQFGHFNPHLGDGRAHLLGEIRNSDGQIQELHLKGSGATPFSRNGDGKCAIKPAVREFIMSEAMFALGVPTTRTLAVVATGEPLYRQQETTGAIVTRVATSHLRVGTFEYFAARGMHEELELLVNLAISRHYPEIDINSPNKYLELYSQVIGKTVQLIVQWMRVGFIHGVMNTDNTLLSGETIDYGPCAMLGVYHPSAVYSSIDKNGRYAFGNQPNIAHWNLARLAECFIPLIDKDEKTAIDTIMPVLKSYADKYETAFNHMMANKLGFNKSSNATVKLSNDLLSLMQQNKLDYTQTFHSLSSLNEQMIPDVLNQWRDDWKSELKENSQSHEEITKIMQRNNPLVIPRNHHVEAVLKDVEENQSSEKANEFLSVLRSPYEKTAKTHEYQDTNPEYDFSYQTFCGT